MLYIIGGLPRSGKSLVGYILTKDYNIAGIDTDLLRIIFDAEENTTIGFHSKLNIEQVTQKIWPYIHVLIQHNLSANNDFYITGEALAPKLLSQYKDDSNCKICFMGFNNVEQKFNAIRNNGQKDDWTKKLSDEKLKQILEKYYIRSQKLEQECEKYGFKFIDTTFDYPHTNLDFPNSIKEVLAYLLPKQVLGPIKLHKDIKHYMDL